MSNPIHRIEIPDAKPESIEQQAGGIVIDAMTEAGMDHHEALSVPMVRELIYEWGQRRLTRDQFIDNCRKVCILNPGLRL